MDHRVKKKGKKRKKEEKEKKIYGTSNGGGGSSSITVGLVKYKRKNFWLQSSRVRFSSCKHVERDRTWDSGCYYK